MAAEKIEIRFMVPTELAAALDAIAMADSMERNQLAIKWLFAGVRDYLHKSSMVHRSLRGNPLLAEADGKNSELGAL